MDFEAGANGQAAGLSAVGSSQSDSGSYWLGFRN